MSEFFFFLFLLLPALALAQNIKLDEVDGLPGKEQ
jgi:hypothetical protein